MIKGTIMELTVTSFGSKGCLCRPHPISYSDRTKSQCILGRTRGLICGFVRGDLRKWSCGRCWMCTHRSKSNSSTETCIGSCSCSSDVICGVSHVIETYCIRYWCSKDMRGIDGDTNCAEVSHDSLPPARCPCDQNEFVGIKSVLLRGWLRLLWVHIDNTDWYFAKSSNVWYGLGQHSNYLFFGEVTFLPSSIDYLPGINNSFSSFWQRSIIDSHSYWFPITSWAVSIGFIALWKKRVLGLFLYQEQLPIHLITTSLRTLTDWQSFCLTNLSLTTYQIIGNGGYDLKFPACIAHGHNDCIKSKFLCGWH